MYEKRPKWLAGSNRCMRVSPATAGQMRPDTLRRYLHRADVRGLIADERNAYLAWATSANAQVLALIRDCGTNNEAARVRACWRWRKWPGCGSGLA